MGPTGTLMANLEHLLVTGGCGFIGSNFVRHILKNRPGTRITVLDKMTYAARRENLTDELEPIAGNLENLEIVHGDIGNLELVRHLVASKRTGTPHIDTIINFAAETHVDRSILDPFVFSQTNLIGTHTLLEAARERNLRYHQISTDEVYGHVAGTHHSLETDGLQPRSPYSASKADRKSVV